MPRPPGDEPGSAPRATASSNGESPSKRPDATVLVAALDTTFREQVRRALDFSLDGSVESLAFVDHYLRLAQSEDREPIVSLIAAGAGAYFGNLIAQTMGATWVGDGKDPRRLRLLLAPQLVHFSPVDMSYEAIASRAMSADDPRIADGPAFDPGFHLRPPRPPADDLDDDDDDVAESEPPPADPSEPEDDASWLQARLNELPPVPEDHFHSLTCRYETLQLMLEMLAAKHVAEGRSPRTLGLTDYLSGLVA